MVVRSDLDKQHPAKASQSSAIVHSRRRAHGKPKPKFYVVRSGDSLSQIAVRHHVPGGWQTLAYLNRATIANPNLIFVDQHIKI